MEPHGADPQPIQEDLYDLLRALVTRMPWATEAEAARYTGLLNRLEELNVFGYLASQVTVAKPPEGRRR